ERIRQALAVTHPRWEPYAGKPPVRFCAGACDETHVPTATEASSSCVRIGRPSDCADEVILARKGANSPTRGRKLRSTGTKASTRVHPIREPRVQLEERLAEALEQQAAMAEVLRIISTSPTKLQPVLDVVVKSAAPFWLVNWSLVSNTPPP